MASNQKFTFSTVAFDTAGVQGGNRLPKMGSTIVLRLFLSAMIITLCPWILHGQSTIAYTVDPDFNTQETLRSKTSVFDIYPLEDGGFFLGGGFNMFFTNPTSSFIQGLAMVTANGSVHPDWGGGQSIFCRELHVHNGGFISATGEFLSKELFNGDSWFFTFGDIWGDYYKVQPWGIGNNPYNVRWTWDIFILEDQSVLIGGAIATDTLQPGLFRHLMRLLPDGSHDDTFPIVEAMPQGLNTHISKIERAGDGSWYVSGRFEGINGHVSPHIAKLNSDFSVDTDFVSPFFYESISSSLHTELKLLDSQERLWFSGVGVRLSDDPDEVFHLVRLLPNGSVDPTFEKGKLSSEYPQGWYTPPNLVVGVVESVVEENVYFLHGVFSHYNDTAQPCITAINDQGYIEENYFSGQGATANAWDPDDDLEFRAPTVRAMEMLSDGSILFGGAFSDFMGVERYSMVKLIQGTVGTSDQDRLQGKIKVYPNPAKDLVTVQLVTERSRSNRIESIRIVDLSGRTVSSYPWQSSRVGTLSGVEVDVSDLAEGLYIVEIVQEGRQISSNKIIVQH